MKFVEAKQPGLIDDDARKGGQGVFFLAHLAGLLGLAEGMDAAVDFLHEGVEMNVFLGFDRAMLEEQVHQHCFAAPDAAPHVDALGRRLFAAA